MTMHNPCHPGGLVKEDCLEPLGLTVKGGAEVLGVSRQTLSNLVNEKVGVSPEMAIRLEKAFGSTAETWLHMQLKYDIWRARQRSGDLKIARCESV